MQLEIKKYLLNIQIAIDSIFEYMAGASVKPKASLVSMNGGKSSDLRE